MLIGRCFQLSANEDYLQRHYMFYSAGRTARIEQPWKRSNLSTYVTTKLMEKGVKEDEIIIWPVSYMDYFYKPFIIGSEPED